MIEHMDPKDQDRITPSAISRRRFTVAGALGVGATLAGAQAASAETRFRAGTGEENEEACAKEGRRPNILVIMADDLGWGDLSCFGSPHIKTPNLDRLARQGVRFTDGYAGSSTCSPTRFSLYTGRYPGRTASGLQEPISGRGREAGGLPPEHPTMASLLRVAGYETVLYGKWHCGHLPWFSPLKSGWDEWLGNLSGGMDYFSKIGSSGGHDLYENDVEHRDLRYYTDILTERTVAYIGRDHQKPWLMNLNYTTPHWPWEGPDDQAISAELSARARAKEARVLFHYDGGSVVKYKEMVENLDASIGAVLDALRSSGQERNTLVLFKSDNGGERFSYQWPLRGTKWDVLEGGIRVPTILRWPARIRGNQVCDLPVVTMDWTRTLLAVGGGEPHPEYPMDGMNLSRYLLEGEDGAHDLFWRVVDQGALRRGDWKYWAEFDVQRRIVDEKLFDLSTDQREEADLARKKPEQLAELRTAWASIERTLLPYPPGAKRFGT